jgi:hypothetical protein
MSTRSYTELRDIPTFKARYEYLRIGGVLGEVTFGFERSLNQDFYRSAAWKRMREFVISRDLGLDLGAPDHQVAGRFIIHHMNPLSIEDVEEGNEDNLNPEYLITTTHLTHNAIHYGDASLLRQELPERRPGDTRLW